MGEKEDKIKEIVEKYDIDLKKLEQEQLKLAKNISTEDKIDFRLADRVAGIDNIFLKNKIISGIIVMSDGEIVEKEYVQDKVKFPYIPGFRAYRELPTMVAVLDKLDEKPDLVFIRGHGILHPRKLGIASHFSLATSVPAVGIADSLLIGEIEDDTIFLEESKVGKVIKSKLGAKPIYVSPGNLISVVTAADIAKKYIKEQHKLPEPLRLAKKYTKEIKKEIFKQE